MKIIFFTSADFTISLVDFFKKKNVLTGLVTAPDKPKDRGLKIVESPVKTYCHENGIPIITDDLGAEHLVLTLKAMAPDYIFVSAYGKILPKEILNIPKSGVINIHYSLLPKYRGPSCIQYPLLNGDPKTGVSIIYLNEKIDAGPVIAKKEVDIDIKDDLFSLTSKLVEAAYFLLNEIWDLEKDWKLISEIQSEAEATFTKKILKEDGKINFKINGKKIYNMFRAFKYWPKLYFYYNKKRVIITSLEIDEKIIPSPTGTILPFWTGNNYNNNLGYDVNSLNIVVLDSVLIIKKVKPENKPEISGRDFFNGLRLKVGNILDIE